MNTTAALDTIKADIEQAKTIEGGVAAFVRGLGGQIRDAMSEVPAEVHALLTEAEDRAEEFGQAAKANTPFAGTLA